MPCDQKIVKWEWILAIQQVLSLANHIGAFDNVGLELKFIEFKRINITSKLSVCKLQDMKGVFFNSGPRRVSLLGYGNMSGETMIFEVDGASQRKL